MAQATGPGRVALRTEPSLAWEWVTGSGLRGRAWGRVELDGEKWSVSPDLGDTCGDGGPSSEETWALQLGLDLSQAVPEVIVVLTTS